MKTKKVVSIKSEENIRKLPSQSDYTQQDAIEEFVLAPQDDADEEDDI